jgi:SAM-dependent methyltransferase
MRNYIFDQQNRIWVREDYVRRIDYSDGAEVEQRIYEAVRQSSDVSSFSDELETHIFNWPSHYFFSKKRANLLRPFASLFKGKHILEPGCGAGTITRFLGECGAYVYAVEPNAQRARIAAERCRDLPNVTVFCDDIGGFVSDRQFDGVLLIGVLEYASKYDTQEQAPLRFIKHLQQFLQPDGFMITAIENQLGLKYFAGFAEDHLGTLMHGINNNYQPGEVTTFGRKALIDLFESAGFMSNRLFLPFPDYKMPSMVVYPGFDAQKGLNLENILSNVSWQDTQKRVPLFSLDKTLPLIAENGLLFDLANSFCLLSEYRQQQVLDNQVLLTIYDGRKETSFRQEGEKIVLQRNSSIEPYYNGVLHFYELVKIVNRDNWSIDQVRKWLDEWLQCLKKEFTGQPAAISSLYFNAIPINLLKEDGTHRFIGLELNNNEDVELGYLVFRAMYDSFKRLSSVAPPADPACAHFSHIVHALLPLTNDQLESYYKKEGVEPLDVLPVRPNLQAP